jgi:HK97 family phage prohead protease
MSAIDSKSFQYKATAGPVNLDEAEGIVECFVAGIGNKDSVGDVCASGAFAKSLQRRKPRVVWGHNWNDPIGKVLEIYEVPANDSRLPGKMRMAGIGGLYARVQFNLKSEKGKEAFSNVAFFGEEQEWSIGYKTLRAQYDSNLQANILYEVELYEVSPVLHGANQLTGTISVKSEEMPTSGMPSEVIIQPAVAPAEDDTSSKLIAELEKRTGSKIKILSLAKNSVVFDRYLSDGSSSQYKCGFHYDGQEFMFGQPQRIVLPTAAPTAPAPTSMPVVPRPISSPMGAPTPGVVKPVNVSRPASSVPMAVLPSANGTINVPLPRIRYENEQAQPTKPVLDSEESALAMALLEITKKYGKFDQDKDGVYAAYDPPSRNEVASIGVKCANCVFYKGGKSCEIIALDVEPEGKCRFAVIPNGVVKGGPVVQKRYEDFVTEESVKWVEDIESKYPGEFISGFFRNTVKKRTKKKKKYKELYEFDEDEYLNGTKSLDGYGHELFVIPVDIDDAFYVKSIVDPVLDYHQVDSFVNEYGIVLTSGITSEFVDAVDIAVKGIGRRIGKFVGSSMIDRPRIGGGDRDNNRGSRGVDIDIPTGGLRGNKKPTGTNIDVDRDGWVDEGTRNPRWVGIASPEQGDSLKKKPKVSLSSGKDEDNVFLSKETIAKDVGKFFEGDHNGRKVDRHLSREQKPFQKDNLKELEARRRHEAMADMWIKEGHGWSTYEWTAADKYKSADYLRGIELGINQARDKWTGDDMRSRPKDFNEKQKAGVAYNQWYQSYVRSLGAYLDAMSAPDDDAFAQGIEQAIRDDVYGKRPDVGSWEKRSIDSLSEVVRQAGFTSTPESPKKEKERLDKAKERKLRGVGSNSSLGSGRSNTREGVAESEFSEGSKWIERVSTENVRMEVIPAKDIYGDSENGYTTVGIWRTDDGGVDYDLSDEVFLTVEDAVEYIENIDSQIADDIYPDDPKFRSVERVNAGSGKKSNTLSSGKNNTKTKTSPLDGMKEGTRLSSGKLDEVYKSITVKLIDAIEKADGDKWEAPWRKNSAFPKNPTNSNRPYSNTNLLFLMFAQEEKGYKKPLWATYKQWEKAGGQVRRGEKGTGILVPRVFKGKEDADGNKKAGGVYYTVATLFNVDQIDGVDVSKLEEDIPKLSESQRITQLETAIKEIGAKITEATQDRAFYRPSTDEIVMPRFEDFKSPLDFYATQAHEMMHWTGHTSRLNRPNMNAFGTEAYAYEELVAEIASAFFMAAHGLSAEPQPQHAKYLASWLKRLKSDPDALQKAVQDAQKATNYAIGLSPSMRKQMAVAENVDDVPGVTIPSGSLSSGANALSSGKNWSDPDVQKQLIDEARKANPFKADGKTESYMASMVRQFDSGKKLTDKQWEPVWNQFNSRISGTSAGKPDKPDSPSVKSTLTKFSGKQRKIIELEDVEAYDYPKLPDNRKPTVEQGAAIDAMMTGEDVKIAALAATGKTTTVINFAERVLDKEPESRIVYLVFNRNAKDDVGQRGMPENVEVLTMDGIAFNAYKAIRPEMTAKSFEKDRAHTPPIKSNKERASYLGARGLVSEGNELSEIDVYKRVSKAVDVFAISADTEIGPQHFSGLDNPKLKVTDEAILPEMIALANKMWADMNDARVQGSSGEKGKGMLPMGNNHITKMWALTKPDIGKTVEANVAMIDEAQDMNPVFAQILKGSNGIQRIYIGDTNQAINAWRGADGSTLDNAYAKYVMPITDSFRFGKEIADRGNRFLSLLGRKERMTGRKTDKSGSPVNGIVGPIDNPTMILTRTNGGAIVATLDTFKNGGTVYGSKNFRNDLDAFINNIEYFQTSANGKGYYVNTNGEKVFAPPTPSKDLDGITNIAEFNKAVEDADNNRLNMLAKLLDENSVDDLRNAIKKIITDKKKLPEDRDSYIHIQTAHTSKGLESPRVKIWSDFRKPKKDANGNVILPDEQELRLSYVAVTRAEEELDLGSLDWIMDYTTDADGASTKLSSGGRAARRVGDTESTTPKDRTSLSSGRKAPWDRRRPPEPPLPARLQKLKDEEDAANGRGGAVDKPKGPPAPPPIPRSVTKKTKGPSGPPPIPKTATEKPKRPSGPPPIPGARNSRLSSGGTEWTKTDDGFEMDAPDIDGGYQVQGNIAEGFVVTRYSDARRNGGQDGQEYEHDRVFKSRAAAKKWAEKDYDKIIENMSGADEYAPDSSRLSSGRKKEIDSMPKRELGRAVYEELDSYDGDTAWDYMEAVYDIEKSDYRYQRGDNEYDSDDKSRADLSRAMSDLMSEEDQRNLLLAIDEHESSPDYDAYKKTGPVYDAIKAKKAENSLSSGKKKKRSSGSKRQPMSDGDRQAFADGVRQRASTVPAKKKSGPDVSEFGLSSGKNNRQRRRMSDDDILPKPLDESGTAELAKGIGSTSRIVVGDVSDNKNRKPDAPWFVESKKIMDLLKDENGELLSDDVLAKAFDIPVEQVAKLRKQGTGIDSESAHKILETTTAAGSGPGGTDDGMRKIWGFDASPHWYDTYDDAKNPKKMNREEFDAMPEEDFKTNVVPMPYEWDDDMSGTGRTEAPVRIRSEVDTTRGTFMLQDLLDHLGKSDATREEIAEILALEIDGKKEKPGLDAIYRWRRDGIPKRTMSKIIEDGIIKRAEDAFGDDGKRFDSNIPQPKFLVALDDMLEKAKTPRTQVQMNEILNMKASNQRTRNSRSGKEGKFSWSVGEGIYYTPSEVDEILFRLNEKLGTNFTMDDLFPSGDNDSKLPVNNPVKDIKPVRMVSPNIPGSKLSSGAGPTPNNGAPENITPKMQKELVAYAKNAKWSNFAQGLIQKLDNGGELSPAQWRALLRMHDNQVKRR